MRTHAITIMRGSLIVLLGVAVSVAASLAVGSGTAWADEKVYAPQFCVAQQLDAAPELSAIELRQRSGPGYRGFVCPLMRDRVTSKLQHVWVRVFNRHDVGQRPPFCCVHAVSLGGSYSDTLCAGAANGFGASSIGISLAALDEYDYGHYAVSCDLDDADSIISIRAQE